MVSCVSGEFIFYLIRIITMIIINDDRNFQSRNYKYAFAISTIDW